MLEEYCIFQYNLMSVQLLIFLVFFYRTGRIDIGLKCLPKEGVVNFGFGCIILTFHNDDYSPFDNDLLIKYVRYIIMYRLTNFNINTKTPLTPIDLVVIL